MIFPAKGFKILAPAKVNLFLEILGKRADGYHEIRSLMQPISLFDIIRSRPASEIRPSDVLGIRNWRMKTI